MKKVISKAKRVPQSAEMKALARQRDDEIDTSDIPEVLDWAGAKRGLFYRPIKQQLTLRIDADVVAWFKAKANAQTKSKDGRSYQTIINRALREYVIENARKRA